MSLLSSYVRSTGLTCAVEVIAPSSASMSEPSTPSRKKMLNFCAEHEIGAEIELISADEIVGGAYDRVVASDVRYRLPECRHLLPHARHRRPGPADQFRRLRAALGLPDNISGHSFRKFVVDVGLDAGLSAALVADQVGHVNPTQNLNTYASRRRPS